MGKRTQIRTVRAAVLLVSLVAFAPAVMLLPAGARPARGDRIVAAAGYDFIVPANSPTQHARTIPENGRSGLEFAGKFLLSGRLHYFTGGSGPGAFMVTLDKASAKRLPRWKDDSSPGDILLDSDAAMQAALLPAALRKAADKSKTREASGPVSLYVDRYTVIIDGCGVSEYSARLLSVRHAGPMQMAEPSGNEEDC